ncbi:MAG: LTA synthase family protein [Thiobacillus sp.]|uniref:LTA synthase family protein n=1 Tax=Thiobacillus sp. TaxID=924 RepID=UPI002736884C|nr:LTA synthase family protein [Thiobacillus sp.]MDP3585135.1 LTA synthase family protein [Thiobacillus sp.]
MYPTTATRLRSLAALYPLTTWLAVGFLLLHTGLRGVLMAQTWHAAQMTLASAISVFGTGLAFDLVSLALLLPAVLLLESALGTRRQPGRMRHGLVLALAALTFFALGFGVLAEWFFWDEFGVRFNFIAVDYLVYTQEVVGNIRESFPVGTLLGGLAVAVLALVWMSRGWLLRAAAPGAQRRTRVGVWLASVAVAGMLGSAWSMDARHGANEYQKELSANGLYSFAYAFGNNEIDYFDFYATRSQISATPASTLPRIVSATPPKNVVIVTMESLSSSYTAHGGNTQGLTPNLDRLAEEGLFLANLRATGNRTVRGLEALSLAIPPLPGHSIIWRKHNQNLETLGAVLADHGYVNRFMYGGYARFDNMDAYFAGNHYQPIDRGQFPERHRGFGNIWGVADEHLYDYALEQMDRDAASGKPFLMHLMTTSNHTPFTFPEGRIDLPRGRQGAVKYSDYAVGRFIEQARTKPWFKDTVFVLVADHCASSKGRTSLPPENYHIPAIVYSPAHLAPHTDTRLASQIDIVPTVLDLLGLPEHTRFMGRSMLHAYPDAGRAFIATYQKLGYLTPDQLVVLSPGRQIEDWQLNAQQELAAPAPQPDTLVARAIGIYQDTARRARDDLLQHVDLSRDLRMR